MNQEYIRKLLDTEGLMVEYRKPFQFGNGVFATNRFIMAISNSGTALSEYGDPSALKPVEHMIESLPDAECRTTFDIGLLKQAIELFDDHRIVNLNLYPKGDGSHYIEIVGRGGDAVLLAGMHPCGSDVKPMPTIKDQFAEIKPTAFRDYGAGI